MDQSREPRDYGDEPVAVPDHVRQRNTSANIAVRRTTSADGRPGSSLLPLSTEPKEGDANDSIHGNDNSNGIFTVPVEPRRYRVRSKKLSRKLKEKHVNMIAFSSVVGVGLYLQNGRVIYLAGPGMAFLIYPVMVWIMWGAIGSLGEMTALYPVPGAMFELPARFLDRSIGYAAGWMAWFTWVVVIAAELDAIATLFRFQFDPAYLQQVNYPQENLGWSTVGVNSAIWIAVFWMFSFSLNMLPIRAYGEIEYWIGVVKMFFFVGLILFQFAINIQTDTGARYYRSPYTFITQSFETWKGTVLHGPEAQLAGVWSAMVVTIFSLVGFESVSITAAENEEFDVGRTYARKESIMVATRKIAIRIMMLYSISTLLVSFNLPANDPNIVDNNIHALGGGQHSAFIIAAVRAGKTFWPGFINGVFLLSATSASINSMYLSSRLLHALALAKPAWPDYRFASLCREWLEQVNRSGWREGVPQNAVLVSSVFGLLGFLACSAGPAEELGRLAINSSVSMLIVYVVICFTYLRFRQILRSAVGGSFPRNADVDDQGDPAAFDRNSEDTYPYRSSGQPVRAFVAGAACFITVLCNGWQTISPFRARDFVASYVGIVVFLALCLAYRIQFLGWKALTLKLEPQLDMRAPTMLNRQPGQPWRDKLQIDTERVWSRRNFRSFLRWVWVWLE